MREAIPQMTSQWIAEGHNIQDIGFTRQTIAFRIGSEILSQASTALRNQGQSTPDRARQGAENAARVQRGTVRSCRNRKRDLR
jgi:hypothetical protein